MQTIRRVVPLALLSHINLVRFPGRAPTTLYFLKDNISQGCVRYVALGIKFLYKLGMSSTAVINAFVLLWLKDISRRRSCESAKIIYVSMAHSS